MIDSCQRQVWLTLPSCSSPPSTPAQPGLGICGSFTAPKSQAWLVCHIQSRLQHNPGLKTAPWLIICWYFLFSLNQHTDCISHKALWRLVYSPLQMDCSPLCHKVNFIVFVHFPNLQITSSCTVITYYWKNRPSMLPLWFQFDYSLHYLDDLNLFFPPHWPFKEEANAPATLSLLARKNNLSSCSMHVPSDTFLFLSFFSFFFFLSSSHSKNSGKKRNCGREDLASL